MTFTITLVQDEERIFIAERPAVPGCVSQGATADETERNILEAIGECLTVRRKQGLPLTIEVRQLEMPVLDATASLQALGHCPVGFEDLAGG